MGLYASMPNVLWIMADQHHADVLGHRGSPVRTPHLDRLAREGVRFDAAVAPSPICTPSRVSMISGQYVHNHGCYGLGGASPEGLPTLFGHFRRAGYRTAAIGKIHCPEYWVERDVDLFREVASGGSVGGNPEYAAYLRERNLAALRDDEGYPEALCPPGESIDARASRLDYADTPEGWSVREAIRFMDEAKSRGAPFFAQVSLVRPHPNYCPSEPFWSMYRDEDMAPPPNAGADLAAKPPHLRAMARAYREGGWILFEPRTYEAARRRRMRGYLGCVSQVDHAVGELLGWLDGAGLADDTIVLYAADHGDYCGQFGLMEKVPGICADAVTRIPFLWRWPARCTAGHRVSAVVEAIDLVPTLCALAGLDPLQTADGVDLSGALAGGAGDPGRIGLTELPLSRSLRRGRYRLVRYPAGMFAEHPDGFGELYDLEADPWEMRNLWVEPASRALAAELTEALLDRTLATTRPRTALPPVRFGGPQARTRFGASSNADGRVAMARLLAMDNRLYH